MLIYYMFLMQTVSSYFYSFRLTLIAANQEGYLFLKIDLAFKVILTVINLINICITRNFIVYLGMGIIINIAANVIKSNKVIKLYPELKETEKLSKEEKKSIYSDVKNLFIGQLSTKILTSTDNIVISKLCNEFCKCLICIASSSIGKYGSE